MSISQPSSRIGFTDDQRKVSTAHEVRSSTQHVLWDMKQRVQWAVVSAIVIAAACAEIGTDPLVAASIEAAPLAFPSVAVGDSMRDTLGVAQPVRALARNMRGDVIEDAPVRYLYLQSERDSAVEVDSVTGHVRVLKQPGGQVQIAARLGSSLQVLIPLRISTEPDTAFRTDSARLVGFVPDTGRRGADSNSVAVSVRVQHRGESDAMQNVGDWIVRFVIVDPANPTNDTTASVFLVNENGRPSRIDTTDATGTASRRVRIRPLEYPAGGTLVDTVEVEAMIWKRGLPVLGAPVRILVRVSSPATRG